MPRTLDNVPKKKLDLDWIFNYTMFDDPLGYFKQCFGRLVVSSWFKDPLNLVILQE